MQKEIQINGTLMIFLLRLPSWGVIEKMERTLEEVRYSLNKVDKYLVNA